MPSKSSGKTIDKIKKNKDKVIIYIGKEKLSLSYDVFTDFYLFEGKNLNEKEYLKLKDSVAFDTYFKKALAIRKRNIITEYKLKEKLKEKGCPYHIINSITKRMKEHDLINDEMYALDYKEYGDEMGYGKVKIISKLYELGINKNIIDKLSFPYKKEYQKAMELLPKLEKKYAKYNSSQQVAHIITSLKRMGYEGDVVYDIAKEIHIDNKEEDKIKLKKDYEKLYSRLKNKYEGYELKQRLISTLINKGYRRKDILEEMDSYGQFDD